MADLRIQILASGSKGNALLVWTDNTCIMVDAGLSGKAITEKMKFSPVDPGDVDAILVSHEHIDHVRGIGVLSRRYNMPVYLSEGTLTSLPKSVGEIKNYRIFRRGRKFTVGDISVQPFSLSHDAEEPVGFVLSGDGKKIALCTDLGMVTELVKVHLRYCNLIVVEANHEVDLLMNGPYPWELKQRIRSRLGHLSNEESIALCREVYHCDLHAVCFAHLSEINNSPERVRSHINGLREDGRWKEVRLFIADQYEPTGVITI
ncbi:MBL fold metallo-hydrolase [Thermodesulforhabdus norvegica]|uniref:Phosphoribosyl 1,2-cyclic phosphodiesterase n=1 Tax=Thermodesulforhabdus norvegica TaxID=39841 RepID=A0A1I4VL31_9BACT|nr:MBL fold metallo-hydrolase [Thermodesulforhabdus norvegica]SFN01958.1 Phosphoribosyl 1,2-cyclic phosphodiesterase [Thermodesulforhabdus norvegica]